MKQKGRLEVRTATGACWARRIILSATVLAVDAARDGFYTSTGRTRRVNLSPILHRRTGFGSTSGGEVAVYRRTLSVGQSSRHALLETRVSGFQAGELAISKFQSALQSQASNLTLFQWQRWPGHLRL